MNDATLDRLLSARNARYVCPDTICRIWAECRGRHKKPKDAERAARQALHGITGAFMTPSDARQLDQDMRAFSVHPTDGALQRMLSRHASTRERLPLSDTDALFARLSEITGHPGTVLDVACGINPIYLGARGIDTTGLDISTLAVDAVNRFRDIHGAPVQALCADVLCPGAIPGRPFDVALLLKLLPLLKRQRDGAALDVMSAIDARWLVVSFPTRTLGGRNVGMAAQYSQWMACHIPPGRAVAARFETANELFFVMR